MIGKMEMKLYFYVQNEAMGDYSKVFEICNRKGNLYFYTFIYSKKRHNILTYRVIVADFEPVVAETTTLQWL